MKRKNLLLLLIAGLWLLSGCGSDALAPHDTVPATSEHDSAYQAGLVAYAVAAVGPLAVTIDQKSMTYTFPQEGDIQGSVDLDFRTGGAQGSPALPSVADYVEISTLGEHGLVIESPLGGQIYLTADIMASIAHGEVSSATVLEGSHGTLEAGAYAATYTISGLTVYDEGYPTGGPIVFQNGYHSIELNFDGTEWAQLSFGTATDWYFNLNDFTLHFGPPTSTN